LALVIEPYTIQSLDQINSQVPFRLATATPIKLRPCAKHVKNFSSQRAQSPNLTEQIFSEIFLQLTNSSVWVRAPLLTPIYGIVSFPAQ